MPHEYTQHKQWNRARRYGSDTVPNIQCMHPEKGAKTYKKPGMQCERAAGWGCKGAVEKQTKRLSMKEDRRV
jgi:hypothetical protein